MDQKKLNHLWKVLDTSALKHIRAGGELIRGHFWDSSNLRCCPIRAAIIQYNNRPSFWDRLTDFILGEYQPISAELPDKLEKSYSELLSDVLGFSISSQEIWAIIRGWDKGYEMPENEKMKPFFILGKKLVEKYHPVSIEGRDE